jgi:hypothetical protein
VREALHKAQPQQRQGQKPPTRRGMRAASVAAAHPRPTCMRSRQA